MTAQLNQAAGPRSHGAAPGFCPRARVLGPLTVATGPRLSLNRGQAGCKLGGGWGVGLSPAHSGNRWTLDGLLAILSFSPHKRV